MHLKRGSAEAKRKHFRLNKKEENTMQAEILNDMRRTKEILSDAKKALETMSVSLYGSIVDSILEYNELFETNYVISIQDVVKQPEKRKSGRPKGSVSKTGKTIKKSTNSESSENPDFQEINEEMARATRLVPELLHSRP